MLRSPVVPSAVWVSRREALPQHHPVPCPKEVPRCNGATQPFTGKRFALPCVGAEEEPPQVLKGSKRFPNYSEQTFQVFLRSEETLPGSSRDQRGAQCQGLMPPPPPPPPSPVVPHPGELSPPAQRPAVLHKRFGEKGLKETLQNTDVRMALGLSSHSGGGGRAPALAEPPAAAECLAHPAGSAFRDALPALPSQPGHGPGPAGIVTAPRAQTAPSAGRTEPGEQGEISPGCGYHLAVQDLGEVSSLAPLQPRAPQHQNALPPKSSWESWNNEANKP